MRGGPAAQTGRALRRVPTSAIQPRFASARKRRLLGPPGSGKRAPPAPLGRRHRETAVTSASPPGSSTATMSPPTSPPMTWVERGAGAVPGGGQGLRLYQKGGDFTITVGETELMSDYLPGSERALATLACARLAGRRAPRVLIGGLGMGFTLRAALDALPADAEVVVAELVPAVAEWARGPLAHLFAGSLDDARVTLLLEDVVRTIQAGRARYDAILLDVDNGPSGFVRRANDRLYDRWGLRRARFALRPGGVLAVWSGRPDRRFKARLKREGFCVEEVRVRSGVTHGRRHVLWLAEPPAAAP